MIPETEPVKVFYSYAQEDQDLCDTLDKHLSQLKRQGVIAGWHNRLITAGSDWKQQVDEHLKSAQIILLLISADFMASDYYQDIEVKSAMERHAKGEAHVIPIILRPVDWEGAIFGKLHCLPSGARPVTLWEDRDAAFLDIARGIRKAVEEIRQTSTILPSPPEETKIPTEVHSDVWWRRRSRFYKYTLITAIGTSIIVFCLSWIGIIGLLNLDTMTESLTMALGELFITHKPFSDKIVMVPITRETEKRFGQEFSPSWRGKQAVLIKNLSQAGAKVIVFDFTFSEKNDLDSEFINAIKQAKEQGTSVIVGIQDLDENGIPKITEGIKQAVSGFGAICVGDKWGYSITVPLVIEKTGHPEIPSLSFKAMAAEQGGTIHVAREQGGDRGNILITLGSEKIDFSNLELVPWTYRLCPVIQEGDTVAEIFLILSPTEKVLRDPKRSYPYENVYQANPNELEWAKDKIVLVGLEREKEMFTIYWGLIPQHRFGLELHADALNMLLNRITVYPLKPEYQLMIMALLGGLGAFVRYWIPETSPYWRSSVILLVTIFYLASTIYIYSQWHFLLNTVYHIAAVWFAYWVTGRIEKCLL